MGEEKRDRFHESAPKVRVTDVARLAGVAPATVSRAINEPGRVSPDKRDRIDAAMRELGYVRNYAARALRSQRSHMVGILIPTLDYALYASLVGAATERLSNSGISTLIATFDYDLGNELKEARLLIERGAEALILIGQKHVPELHEILNRHEVPFVNTYTLDPQSTYPAIGFDNAEAAASITRHLVHLGHRNFGVISGRTRDNDRTTSRLTGIKRELESHGIALGSDRISMRSYSISNGREACAELLSRIEPRPTALICGNDVLALGAIVECRERGLRVPQDISIVGFDNLELSKHSNPPLTTIDVPAEQMGSAAANYLLERLSGEDNLPQQLIEVQLILRASTAPPPPANKDS